MGRFEGYRIEASRKRADGTTERHFSECESLPYAEAEVERLRASGWDNAAFIHRGFDWWTAP